MELNYLTLFLLQKCDLRPKNNKENFVSNYKKIIFENEVLNIKLQNNSEKWEPKNDKKYLVSNNKIACEKFVEFNSQILFLFQKRDFDAKMRNKI